MTNIIKNTFIVISSLLLLLLFTVLIVLWTFSNSIPDYRFLKNYKPPVSSKMYSGEGDLVADFSKEKRIFVPYETIPENVINSFLSAEDKNPCLSLPKSINAACKDGSILLTLPR